MKVIRNKWKMIFYAMGGMGVNMLNLIIGAYLCDALMIEAFNKKSEEIIYWTYANKTLIVVVVWSIIGTFAKILDGVIDIPLASFSDNLRTKWGRRRPALLMGLIPMMLAYVAFLNPVSSAEYNLGNTIYLGIMLCLFYIFYTLTMGTYYATFSEIVDNDKDRVLLSHYKSVFDVIYFALGFGLIPLMISAHLNIRIIGYIFLPLALTMLIPVFMIKEKSNLKRNVSFDMNAASVTEEKTAEAVREVKESGEMHGEGENVGIIKSLKYCITNKNFMLWMVVYAALQFGLQLFLSAQNVYYNGVLELPSWQMTVLMAAAFAPVPATLLLYNHFVRKRGLKFGFLFSLAMFTVAMIIMAMCHPKIIESSTIRFVFAIVGSLISSFGIGCFFSIGYTVPSALADLDLKEKGISHPTMFFAVQGLVSGIAAALSTRLIWDNIKNVGYAWLLPIIVIASNIIAIALTFLLPKGLGMFGKRQEEKASVVQAEEQAQAEEQLQSDGNDEAEEQAQAEERDEDNAQDDNG